MKPSQSDYVTIRGLKYHCRTWGKPGARQLFLLHGYQDVSASWQFTVAALKKDWHVIAPDWRGYGLTEHTGADAYWFADYLGDLDLLLEHYSPNAPAHIVAHSMGGFIASVYAGVKPDRVALLINIEGFAPPGGRQDPAPRRLAKWLTQLRDNTNQRPYADFDDFAIRLQAENPRLSDERARFLVPHWGMQEADGTVVRRADPAHKRLNPTPMPTAEIVDCWAQTQAPVVWVHGTESGVMSRLMSQPSEFEARRRAYQMLRIEDIAESGHNVHHDQPEQLAATIERFC